jgi:hypothetical protein
MEQDAGLAHRVQAVAGAGLPPAASQLVGPYPPGPPHTVAHAVRLGSPGEAPAGLPELAGLDGVPVARWLVWLGTAGPPLAASHLRLALTDERSPVGRTTLVRLAVAAGVPAGWLRGRVLSGLLLPLGEDAPLLVTPAAGGGVDVVGGSGPVWHEVPVHAGRRVADAGLAQAGLVARVHHRQVLPASVGRHPAHRLVLLVRGAQLRDRSPVCDR